MNLPRENSLNAVSLGRQIVLPTGVLLLPVEQANKEVFYSQSKSESEQTS